MLEIKNLVVKYGGITALQGISLSIPEGKIVSMVGANGAGKSTAINAVSGMVKKAAGGDSVQGDVLGSFSPEKSSNSASFRSRKAGKIFSAISVKENILMGGPTPSATRRGSRRAWRGMYKLFPILEKRKNQPGGTLSGGEQQMLAIARALMSEPTLLLLDEPSLGLAPKLILDIFRLIQDLHSKGLTILLVEQNARKALSISDYAYVLETGRIIARGDRRGNGREPRGQEKPISAARNEEEEQEMTKTIDLSVKPRERAVQEPLHRRLRAHGEEPRSAQAGRGLGLGRCLHQARDRSLPLSQPAAALPVAEEGEDSYLYGGKAAHGGRVACPAGRGSEGAGRLRGHPDL